MRTLKESIYGNLGISDSITKDVIVEQLKKWHARIGNYTVELPIKPGDPYIIKSSNACVFRFDITDDSSFDVPVRFKGLALHTQFEFNVKGKYTNFLKNIDVTGTDIAIKYEKVKDIVISDDMFDSKPNLVNTMFDIKSDITSKIDLSKFSYNNSNMKITMAGGEIWFNSKQHINQLTLFGSIDAVHALPQIQHYLNLNIYNANVNKIFDIFSDYRQKNPKLQVDCKTKELLHDTDENRMKLLIFFRDGDKML